MRLSRAHLTGWHTHPHSRDSWPPCKFQSVSTYVRAQQQCSSFENVSFESCGALCMECVLNAHRKNQTTIKLCLYIFIKKTNSSAVQRLTGALVPGRSRNLPAPLTSTLSTANHQHQPPRLGNLTASLSKRNREYIILDAFGLFVIVWCSAHHSLTHQLLLACWKSLAQKGLVGERATFDVLSVVW